MSGLLYPTVLIAAGVIAAVLIVLILKRASRRKPIPPTPEPYVPPHGDDPRFDRGFPRPDAAFDPGWRDVYVGLEGDGARIGKLAVWKEDWRRIDTPSLILWHPSYPQQRHTMEVYEIGPAEKPVRFAAGELSMNVWGFFIPA